MVRMPAHPHVLLRRCLSALPTPPLPAAYPQYPRQEQRPQETEHNTGGLLCPRPPSLSSSLPSLPSHLQYPRQEQRPQEAEQNAAH